MGSVASIHHINKISSAIDRLETTARVFLDLSKAFDTIDHQILFGKLERYGIRGLALDWIKSFFSCRQQFVQFNSTCSSKQTIKCGVPQLQGSILGIVNRCRLVMKLDKFLCFMFLFAFLALTLHKTREKHAFFGRITNQKFRLIYSKLTCEPKTKDCAGSRSVQHTIAAVFFLLLKLPGFHNKSLD